MNAKQEAKLLRRSCRASGRLNVDDLAQLLGLEVDRRQFRVKEVEEIVVGSSVAVSDHLDDPERRWAMAHAIGHRVLHGSNHVWLRTCTQLPEKLEAQAERFAYYLLVDGEEAWREGLRTAQEIAGYFGVPERMVRVQGRLL